MVQLDGLIEYSDAELEQKAHEYLRRRQDVQFKIPVNAEALLENCEGVGDVDTIQGIVKMTRTEGVVCRHLNQRDLRIFLDEEVVDFGSRATLSAVLTEELAHILLHKAIFFQVKSVGEFIEVLRSPQWHRIERDAKVFSAAIRMPFKNLILAAEGTYPDIVDEHGFSDVATIQKLVRNAIAEKFAVPPEDAQRRLMQWPCRVYDRVAISAQCRLSRLAPADAVPQLVHARTKQKLIF